TVTVSAGDTSEVAFAVTCVGNLPGLRGTIATTGTDVDPDGYWLEVVDHSWCARVPVNGSSTCSGMTPGTYEVQLTGVAPNCAVSGAPARAVTVSEGATAELSFAVTCSSATVGSIRVTTRTTGDDIDPNGYQVNDPTDPEGYPILLPANGSVVIDRVQSGD